MKNTVFLKTLKDDINTTRSHICVGLDSDYDKLPESVTRSHSITDAIFNFNKAIIDATHDVAVAFKSNVVFYAGYGIEGLTAMQKTNEYIKAAYPGKKTIADCKRSEMLRSAQLTARELFDAFKFDAFTVTPWFGFDTIEPYQTCEGKAVFVPCHDSNPSAGDIQDLKLESGEYLYEYVTKLVSGTWNTSGNIFIEAPLTYPTVLSTIYKLTGEDDFFMIAGLGAQGGNVNELMIFKERKNFIVSASRSIIFNSNGADFAEAARAKVIEYTHSIDRVIS